MSGYNRRMEIQSKTVAYGIYNEPIDTWATIASVWCGVVTTGGGEFYAAQKLKASTQAIFKIRYGNVVNVTNRIKYNNKYFEILSINDVDEAHNEIQIAAKEVI